MRWLVLLVVLAFAAPAAAQDATPAPPAQGTENPNARPEWKGPSGFWTSPYPAKGGAYRWRMMAIGGVLLLGTGLLTWRLVKKAGAERSGREAGPRGSTTRGRGARK